MKDRNACQFTLDTHMVSICRQHSLQAACMCAQILHDGAASGNVLCMRFSVSLYALSVCWERIDKKV